VGLGGGQLLGGQLLDVVVEVAADVALGEDGDVGLVGGAALEEGDGALDVGGEVGPGAHLHGGDAEGGGGLRFGRRRDGGGQQRQGGQQEQEGTHGVLL